MILKLDLQLGQKGGNIFSCVAYNQKKGYSILDTDDCTVRIVNELTLLQTMLSGVHINGLRVWHNTWILADPECFTQFGNNYIRKDF